MRIVVLLFLLAPFAVPAQQPLQPVGAWREHLPYQSAIDVVASPNKIFCATPYSLFSVATESKEASRISKLSGLSETGISAIGFDAMGSQLIVAYTNSNIDVLTTKGFKNVPDIKREAVTGNKTINHIYAVDRYAYLATGFGVVVLDLQQYEVKDTWFIGQQGEQVNVNRVTRDALFYYAATAEGLKRAPISAPNLADFNYWQTISGTAGLPLADCKGVVTAQNKIVAWQGDSLWVQGANGWTLFYADGNAIVSINATEKGVAVGQQLSSGEGKVVFINAAGTIEKTLTAPGVIALPEKAIAHTSGYWVADGHGGLSHWSGNTFERYQLNSPQGRSTGPLAVFNNTVYAAGGGVDANWNGLNNTNGIAQFKNGEWTNFNGNHFPKLDSFPDVVSVAVDPRDESVWAGSFGGGLLHIKAANNFQIYKQDSPIGTAAGQPNSYRVSGLTFDTENNLWIANFGATRPLHVLKKDGNWQSFTPPFSTTQNALSQIVIDDADQKWIIAPKGDGLLVFNHGADLTNTADDKWKLYRTGSGNGNLPSNYILSIAKDKNGFIWVGTRDGIGIIQCPEAAFTTGCDALLPITKDGNFANYLFKGEEVRSIAVDGADRKWIATKTGVWLINSDGEKVRAHFTEEASPLLSNDVKQVAVDGTTGEVFIATAKGIISFWGTATEGATTNENLLVYPNPVPPGYGGTIAIKGLAENSFVKITELDGRLVFQTRASGGQAVWDGKDYRGRKIATGIYLVLVANEGRTEKAVGKIVFISK